MTRRTATRPGAGLKPLWRCPQCGAKLVTRGMWHSCGRFSLAALFARSEPAVRALFRKFAARVRRDRRVAMIPQKTRVVFMDRVRFASCQPRRDHFLAGFILGRRVRDRRIVRVEKFGPDVLYHYVRVFGPADVDAALLGWMRESHRHYGRQERLASAPVARHRGKS